MSADDVSKRNASILAALDKGLGEQCARRLNSVFPLRHAFDGQAKRVSDDTALVCPEPTLAQQQFKDDSDPNRIMAEFARVGDPAILAQVQGQYGDFTGVNDYQSSLNIVLAAEASFNALPARVRTRFDNDAGKFAAFLDDASNFDEAVELGLLKPDAKPPTPPQKAGGKDSLPPVGGDKPVKVPSVPKGYKLIPEGDSGDD